MSVIGKKIIKYWENLSMDKLEKLFWIKYAQVSYKKRL